jgi:cysteine synthase A
MQRIRCLASLIGNTPLLAIDFEFRGRHRRLYAKAEHLNMTGSIKDRMAFEQHRTQAGPRPLLSSVTVISNPSSSGPHRSWLAGSVRRSAERLVVLQAPDAGASPQIEQVGSRRTATSRNRILTASKR